MTIEQIHSHNGPPSPPWPTPPTHPEPIDWGRALAFSVKALVAWKALQYLTDEDYGDGEYPRSVRHGLIDEHVQTEGCFCPECGQRVRRANLTVDHAWPMSKGGRTSLNNARVICRSCNSRKGNRLTILDMIRGLC